jgi:excisionase family DNA binding protein
MTGSLIKDSLMRKGYKEELKEKLLEKELNRMLSVTEAAEVLGVSKSTVRRLNTINEIKSYRIGTGRHRRFRKKDLLDYLEESS